MMSVVPEPSISARRMRRPSNRSGRSNRGALIHRDLGAEAAVAEVRPVAHFAVADAHEVGQSVAGHVGEEDGFGAVGEDELRALVPRRGLAARAVPAPKPAFGQRRVPAEGVVFADQQIGEAVAGQIDELEIADRSSRARAATRRP